MHMPARNPIEGETRMAPRSRQGDDGQGSLQSSRPKRSSLGQTLRKPPAAKASSNPSGQPANQLEERLGLKKRPEMTWPDHLAMLLHVAAEIEHALMVQYLYAAYSLGGDQIPEKDRPMVQRWQKSILSIAKEEMGHLLTVQNLLTLVGAPINLYRENFPWDSEYYPFKFVMQKFSLASLEDYIYAEMPDNLPGSFDVDLRDELKEIHANVIARHKGGAAHSVHLIYDHIIKLISDEEAIPDAVFREHTYAFQASWDDWGRGYKVKPKRLDPSGSLEVDPVAKERQGAAPPEVVSWLNWLLPFSALPQRHTPDPANFPAVVLIDRVATRAQALEALRALSVQGEAPELPDNDEIEPSHFVRFLRIHQDYKRIIQEKPDWTPSRPVPVNPTTDKVAKPRDPDRNLLDYGTYISAKFSNDWASLFNLRYRMLLSYLSHTFSLAQKTRGDVPNVRAMVMHKVFGEMYNLKTIAGILVSLPLVEGGDPARAGAGPPFEVPYNLDMPVSQMDIWRSHRDLLESSRTMMNDLLNSGSPLLTPDGRDYLKVMLNLDGQTMAWIDRILAGHSPFAGVPA
jgi:hypothetical protein